ncbi:MAG: TPM domain-containing protein [Candidatus Paceibacterota bacterium]
MKLTYSVLIALFLLITVAIPVCAYEYPSPQGYVSDFANILSQNERQGLENEIAIFENQTTIEIAVVTVPSLQGMSIEEFTLGLANTWGVGKKGKDNGVVLLVAPNERKVRIEVGRGLEGTLTNSAANGIIQNDILPSFRNNRMQDGIVSGAHSIMRQLSPKAATQNSGASPGTDSGNDINIISAIIIIGLIIIGIIASLWAAIWVSDKRDRKRENLDLLEKDRKMLKDLKQEYPESKDLLQKLESNNPPAIWLKLKAVFDSIDLAEMKKNFLEAEALCKKNLLSVDEASGQVKSLDSDVKEQTICLKNIKKRFDEVEKAASGIDRFLLTLPEEINFYLKQVGDEDVAEGTRRLLQSATSDFEKIRARISETEVINVNRLEVCASLKDVSETLKEVFKEIKSDKEIAARAPTEGPVLLSKFPEILAATESKIGSSSKRRTMYDDARTKYEQARAIAEQEGVVNWTNIFILLLAANTLCHNVESSHHSDYISQSSSSSHHSDSFDSGGSSFNGFGGFGGGSFGGGGASGGW